MKLVDAQQVVLRQRLGGARPSAGRSSTGAKLSGLTSRPAIEAHAGPGTVVYLGYVHREEPTLARGWALERLEDATGRAAGCNPSVQGLAVTTAAIYG